MGYLLGNCDGEARCVTEDHDARKLYRYVPFPAVGDEGYCPPHHHNRDHWTRCLEGRVEVTLRMIRPGLLERHMAGGDWVKAAEAIMHEMELLSGGDRSSWLAAHYFAPERHVLTPEDPAVLVHAIAMHSAVGLIPGSTMRCEFDHVDGQGQPISCLGPRWVYD